MNHYKSLSAKEELTVRRWSAVARGGVMYGIEKSKAQKLNVIKPCLYSYGVVLDSSHPIRNQGPDESELSGRITWIVRKDDLLMKDELVGVDREFVYYYREGAPKVLQLPVFEYTDDDDLPDMYENAKHGTYLSMQDSSASANLSPPF